MRHLDRCQGSQQIAAKDVQGRVAALFQSYAARNVAETTCTKSPITTQGVHTSSSAPGNSFVLRAPFGAEMGLALPLVERPQAPAAEMPPAGPASQVVSQVLSSVIRLTALGAARPFQLVRAVQDSSRCPKSTDVAVIAAVAVTAFVMVGARSNAAGKHPVELAFPA